jgi:hypothetical protein
MNRSSCPSDLGSKDAEMAILRTHVQRLEEDLACAKEKIARLKKDNRKLQMEQLAGQRKNLHYKEEMASVELRSQPRKKSTGKTGRENSGIENFEGFIDERAKSYLASFCGKYEDIWNKRVMGTQICTSCVFFPDGAGDSVSSLFYHTCAWY